MVILSIMASALLLKFIADEKPTNVIKYLCYFQSIPTIFLALNVAISYKNEKFAEMFGLSIIIPTIIIVYVSNMMKEYEEMMDI